MTRASLLKVALLAVLVVVSVVIKVQIQTSTPDISQVGPNTIKSFLASNGFSEESTIETSSGVHVRARNGACEVLVKDVAPQGWDESTMQVLAEGKRLFYVTKGVVYEGHQPVWRTWFGYRIWRILDTMGIRTHKTLVFGVVENEACPAIGTDWTGLNELALKPV